MLLVGGGIVWATTGGDDKGDPDPKPAVSSESPKKQQDPTEEPGSDDEDPGGRDGGEDDPNDARRAGEAKVLYQVKGPKPSTKNGSSIPGFWVLDGYVAKTVENKIIAYKDDGTEKWHVSLPKKVCAAPNSQSGGKVVVAYEGRKKDECSKVAMIDLKAGEAVWKLPAPKAGAFGGSYTSMGMAQSGNLVGLYWFGGSGMMRVSDGKDVSGEKLSPGCSVTGFGGGDALLRAYSCTDDTAKLQRLDTKTGKVKWTYKVRKGYQVAKIYSTSPAVIHITDKKEKAGGVLSIKGGEEQAVMDLGKDSYQPRCGMDLMNSNIGGCQGVVASSTTFYLPTEMKKSDEGSSTEIHGFDLATGKRTSKIAVKGRMLLPLRMDGDKLIAYQEPSYDQAGRVLSIKEKGGKPKTLLKNPAATKSAEGAFFSPYYAYQHGHLYLAADRLDSTGSGEKLIMAFGP